LARGYGRHWSLCWAVCHLLGIATGEWLAPRVPARAVGADGLVRECQQRAPALIPVIAGLVLRAPGQWLSMPLVLATATWTGWREASRRRSRRPVIVPAAGEPSMVDTWQARAVLRITGWPRRRGESWSAPAVIVALPQATGPRHGRSPRIGDGVLLRARGREPPLWALVASQVSGRLAATAAVWYGFDHARYLAGRNLGWLVSPHAEHKLGPGEGWMCLPADPLATVGEAGLARLRGQLAACFSLHLPPLEAQLAAAILLGRRDPQLAPAMERLASVGLAHLFAVSGLHVGIVLAVVMALCSPLSRGVGGRLTLALLVLPLYIVLTGMPGSVLRASGLALLALAAPLLGRRLDALHGLALLLWLNVFWAPSCLIDTGLRLSYLAAGGIVAVLRCLQGRLAGRGSVLRWTGTGLAVTLAAQWFTLPEVAAAFGFLNLAAPAVNLIAVPVFSLGIWIWGAALPLTAIWPAAGAALFATGWLVMRSLLAAISATAVWAAPLSIGLLPFGPLTLLAYLLISAIGLRWLAGSVHRHGCGGERGRRLRLAVLTVAACAFIFLGPRGGGKVDPRGPVALQFDVGQGDAAVIRFPDGYTVLIDTGVAWPGGSRFARLIWPWLRRQELRRLDLVVLSHGHADHVGGAADLAERVAVTAWAAGGAAAEAVPPGARQLPRQGAVTLAHRWREWTLLLLDPAIESDAKLDENDRSLVVALCARDTLRALWTGDLETEGERNLLPLLPPIAATGVDYWKAGHHGSRTSGSASLLDALRPNLIGISCGVANGYEHPSHGPYLCEGDTLATIRTDVTASLRLSWPEHGPPRLVTTRRQEASPGFDRGRGSRSPPGGPP